MPLYDFLQFANVYVQTENKMELQKNTVAAEGIRICDPASQGC
jgi:hypothetical protein